MGISKLLTLLRDKSPGAFGTCPLSVFRGKRIAIDIASIMHRAWAISYQDVLNKTKVLTDEVDTSAVTKKWLEYIKYFIFKFLDTGVTPVFVFDGKMPAEKTNHAHKERKAQKDDAIAKLEAHRTQMQNGGLSVINTGSVALLVDLMKRASKFDFNNIQLLQAILTGAGLPVIVAEFEAEEYCARLYRAGIVSAVYSPDTDCLVHGCSMVIRDISNKMMDSQTLKDDYIAETISLPIVLEDLKLTFPQFVDMCILAGCDYNDNIPGIAIVRAYNLITQHLSIDNIPSKYDKTCLNHVACREIFKLKPMSHLRQTHNVDNGGLNFTPSNINRDTLTMYMAESWISKILSSSENFPVPTDDEDIKHLSVNKPNNMIVIYVYKFPRLNL